MEKEFTNKPGEPKANLVQEKLSLFRTEMANQRTFLSFLRTSMYFLVAGLTMRNLLRLPAYDIRELLMYIISGIVLAVGILIFFLQKKKMHRESAPWLRNEDD